MKKPTPSSRRMASPQAKRDPSPYPKGWDRQRVEALIDHYETQSDEEAISEAEAQYDAIDSTMIQVPLALVPKVQKLIARAS
jgi:hypothetical protein